MNKKFLIIVLGILVLFLAGLLLVSSGQEECGPKQIRVNGACRNLDLIAPTPSPFSTLMKGFTSNANKPQTSVVTSRKEWEAFLAQNFSKKITDTFKNTVDFNKKVVLAAFKGDYTGMREYQITDIKEINGRKVVTIKEIIFGKSCIVAQVVQQPYHIVTIDKTDKEISFRVNTEYSECK